MAPFVEMEWGSKAYEIMWELKALFDPAFVLNPGVILNRDPDTHQKFLKIKPVADPIVDMCMECGFCESNCPSRDLSLTPRQGWQTLLATSQDAIQLKRRIKRVSTLWRALGLADVARHDKAYHSTLNPNPRP